MKTAFIDWTDKNLNLYIFNKRGNRYELIDSQSIEIDNELTEENIDSLSLKGVRNLYLSIPPGLLTLREQTFPFTEKEKIRETINYELDGTLLGNIGDYAVDHIITEAVSTGCRVLAICVEKDRLNRIIEMFSSSDLEPRAVTSLDLRLSGGEGEKLLGEPVTDISVRSEAARDELESPAINLRQEELAYTGDLERFLKKVRLTASLALLLCLIIGANEAVRLSNYQKEHELLSSEIEKVYHKVFPGDKKIIDAERQFKGNMNALKSKKQALVGIPVLDILQEIAKKNTPQIQFYEFKADESNLLIKGTAGTFEDVEIIKNSLETVFRGVKVLNSAATSKKKIDFTILMQELRA